MVLFVEDTLQSGTTTPASTDRMRNRISALVLPLLVIVATIACVVDFGCDGRNQMERDFFRQSATTRLQRFRRYPLSDQYKIFRYGMRREPPEWHLADPIAEHGETAISFLREQFNGATDDGSVDGILLIFEAMARLKTYNVRGDVALMNLLASRVSTMKEDFWRAEATKTLESIKQLR